MSVLRLAILPVIVSLSLTSCGKVEERAPWPGYVKSIQGFSDTEKEQITTALHSLNEKSSFKLISDGPTESNFTIEIYKVSAISWPQSRAGFATVKLTACKVELSDILFTSTKTEYLYPVVWHEIGHCAGLGHANSERDIMSPTTSVLAAYPASSISKFIQNVRESAGF